ncbi:MAG TPA: alkaline phosphatase family protein [Candidatus Limnocylindrales bacterium]
MKRVLVFGVDGVRADTLRTAVTPRIDAIAAAGFYSEFDVSDDSPTLSGPIWATVATGQWPRLHGVYTNEFPNNRLGSFADFLTRARDKGHKTYLATSWSPLVTTAHGGPIFGQPSWGTFINGDDLDYGAVDEALAADAARVLSTQDISAGFVYLGNPDHVAHHVGTHKEYVDAIEAADRQIGRIVDAIGQRPGFASEEWTFIVVTDHGHVDGGGHGGRGAAERTAWIAACGPGIAACGPDIAADGPDIAADGAGIGADVRACHGDVRACHVDVAPTVLHALGIRINREDAFAGEPVQKA